LEELQKGNNLILDRYAYSGVAFSSAKVFINNFDQKRKRKKPFNKKKLLFFGFFHYFLQFSTFLKIKKK